MSHSADKPPSSRVANKIPTQWSGPGIRWSMWAGALVLGAIGFLLGFVRDFSNDFHWHLATGNWMLDHGAWMRQDALSYTFFGQPQHVDGWLGDVILAATYRVYAYPASYFLRGIVLTTMVLALFRECVRIGVSSWTACLLPSLMCGDLAFRFYLRTETFTFALLAVLLLVLGEHERLNHRHAQWQIPMLLCLWANVHGSVVVGLAVLLCYLVDRLVRALIRQDREALFPLLRLGFVSVCATLLNPDGARQPFMFFFVSIRDNRFSEGVDWAPFHLGTAGPVLPYALLAIVITVLVAGKRVSVWRLLAGVLLCIASSRHGRFVKPAMIVAVPLMASNLVVVAERLARWMPAQRQELLGAVVRVFGFFASGFVLLVEDKIHEQVGLGPDPGTYPEAACAFAKEQQLPGEVLNDFNLSGYFMFCAPERRTYIDQRNHMVFTPEFREEYKNLADTPELLEKRVAEHDIRSAFLGRNLSLSRYLLQDVERWNLVYFDDLSMWFTRKSHSFEAQTPAFLYLKPGAMGSITILSGEHLRAAQLEFERQKRRCPTCLQTRIAQVTLATASGEALNDLALADDLAKSGFAEHNFVRALFEVSAGHNSRALGYLGAYSASDAIGAASVARRIYFEQQANVPLHELSVKFVGARATTIAQEVALTLFEADRRGSILPRGAPDHH